MTIYLQIILYIFVIIFLSYYDTIECTGKLEKDIIYEIENNYNGIYIYNIHSITYCDGLYTMQIHSDNREKVEKYLLENPTKKFKSFYGISENTYIVIRNIIIIFILYKLYNMHYINFWGVW